MKIRLKSQAEELQYLGKNESGYEMPLSGNKGYSPMEALLTAAAGCSSIDVELILKKMRQELESLEVEVTAKRREHQDPAIFTEIHMHYIIKGQVKEKKAKEAIDLSMQKYCSVTQSLNSDIKLTSSFEIND